MYRLSIKCTRNALSSATLTKFSVRCLATTTSVDGVLFPTKSDFPSRHIGPRKTDVVSMLDTLGYKVGAFCQREEEEDVGRD